MAENYNLNSNFGLNVTNGKSQGAIGKNAVSGSGFGGDLFASIENSSNKYDDVFSGKVEKEINMYSRQAMIVGMNLKASDTKIRNFDMNI